jgi:Tol biopolymer transport system component
VAAGVRIAREYAAADLVVGPGGSLYYVAGEPGLYSGLIWMDRSGNPETAGDIPRARGEIRSLALAPDGERVALELDGLPGEGSDIWIKQLPSGPLEPLTLDSADDRFPRWSPDGQYVFFTSDRSEPRALYRRRADGIGAAALVAQLDVDLDQAWPSPDGRWYILIANDRSDIYLASTDGTAAPRPLLAEPFPDHSGTISPDGRWLAYVSRESGEPAVFVRPFPDVNRTRWRISVEGGTEPVWARSGEELFFRTPARPGRLMAVDVETQPDFQHSPPRFLFLADGARGFTYPLYDVDVDAQRFMLVGTDTRAVDARLVRIGNVLAEAGERLSR